MKAKRLSGLVCASTLCASLLGSSVTVSAAFDPNTGKGNLIIQEAGTYVLTGSMHGSVFVDPGAGDVELIMDNVHIDGGETAGIIVNSGDSVRLTMKEDTDNTISGMGEDPDYLAAIYSNIDMTIGGPGKLTVNCACENGIHSENANITFESGNMDIICKGNGFVQDGRFCGDFFYNGGMITVNGAEFNPNMIEVISEDTEEEDDEETTDEAEQIQPVVDNGQPAQPSTNNGQPAMDNGQPAQPTGDNNQQTQPTMDNGQPAQPTGDNSQQTQPTEQTSTDSQPAQPGTNNGQQTQPGTNNGQPTQPTQNQSMPTDQGTMPGNAASTLDSAESASEVVTGTVTNSAADLEADMESATYITVSDDNSQVSISESGTYVITGTSSDGNIVVKKGTTGVVLVLDDLDLTSTTGATLSVNKNSEVQIVVSGNVTLTDAENPDDEDSEDEEVADAYDGAALKIKDGSDVYITGDGTLTLNGTAKNGIKAGDESTLVIDGELTMNVNASNDGINSNYDIAILSGTLVINSEDDAIHADHILTIGNEDGTGPVVEIVESTEGLEATVVNIYGGDIDINSSDDAINAANSDGIYEGELTYSINMMGGTVDIDSTGDGFDSNGNVNLIDGEANIQSSAGAGEAGIDYDGQLYVSDEFELNNNSGVSGADMMGGMNGQMPGDMGGQMPGSTDSQTTGDASSQMPSDMGNQSAPSDMGQMPSDMGNQSAPSDMSQMLGNMSSQIFNQQFGGQNNMNGQMSNQQFGGMMR